MVVAAIEPLYSVAGAAVGLLVGMTGVGGGSLMTPLLVLAFGFHPVTAVGTDLLYASVTKMAGTAVHGRRNTVDWAIVRRLALGSIPVTAVTLLFLAHQTPRSEGGGHVVAIALGAALIATASGMLFRRRLLARFAGALNAAPERRVATLTVALGGCLGLLVSLSSVGAGALGMTALLLLYPSRPVRELVGTDVAHAVPLTLVAGAGHWATGSVDLALLASLLVGSMPGVVLGSHLASKASDRILQPLLAAILLIVGAKLLVGSLCSR